jgi:hypothetical protein
MTTSAGNAIAKILTVAQGGSSVTLANGSQLLYGAGASVAGLGTALSSAGPFLLLGGVALLLFMMMRK